LLGQTLASSLHVHPLAVLKVAALALPDKGRGIERGPCCAAHGAYAPATGSAAAHGGHARRDAEDAGHDVEGLPQADGDATSAVTFRWQGAQ